MLYWPHSPKCGRWRFGMRKLLRRVFVTLAVSHWCSSFHNYYNSHIPTEIVWWMTKWTNFKNGTEVAPQKKMTKRQGIYDCPWIDAKCRESSVQLPMVWYTIRPTSHGRKSVSPTERLYLKLCQNHKFPLNEFNMWVRKIWSNNLWTFLAVVEYMAEITAHERRSILFNHFYWKFDDWDIHPFMKYPVNYTLSDQADNVSSTLNIHNYRC